MPYNISFYCPFIQFHIDTIWKKQTLLIVGWKLIVTVLALCPVSGRHPHNAFLPCKGRATRENANKQAYGYGTNPAAAFRRLMLIWVFRTISAVISWLFTLDGRALIPASKKAIWVTDIPMIKKNIAGHNETRMKVIGNGTQEAR